MEIIGVEIPIWVLLLISLVLIVVLWRVIKFALKILVVVIIFILILIGLDIAGFFSWVKSMFYAIANL